MKTIFNTIKEIRDILMDIHKDLAIITSYIESENKTLNEKPIKDIVSDIGNTLKDIKFYGHK